MSQKTLPFKYEEEKRESGITSLGGLALYTGLAHIMDLSKSVRNHIRVRQDTQGWTDSQVIMSLILLNLSGGDCVEDLNILEADEGFCRILRWVELHDLNRRERREQERRWRKEKRRSVPSPSAAFRYLEAFHNEEEALYSYKGYKSYQPINVWRAEMIRKVYEVDPLRCPSCGGHMRIIDRIIGHLKLTFEAERPPPPHNVQQEFLMAAEERRQLPTQEGQNSGSISYTLRIISAQPLEGT